MICRPIIALAVLVTAVSVGAATPAKLQLDDPGLVKQMPGAGTEYRMPSRVFSPELIEKIRNNRLTFLSFGGFLYRSIPNDAPKWTSIPLERWQELICDFAPVSLQGNMGNPATVGLSPFTGKLFAGTEMSDEEHK